MADGVGLVGMKLVQRAGHLGDYLQKRKKARPNGVMPFERAARP